MQFPDVEFYCFTLLSNFFKICSFMIITIEVFYMSLLCWATSEVHYLWISTPGFNLCESYNSSQKGHPA